MTPVKPTVERLVAQLLRLRASLPAAMAKKAKAEQVVDKLAKAIQGNQLAPVTANAYRAQIDAWKGALEDPARLQRDIEAIESDLREAASLIAQAVT